MASLHPTGIPRSLPRGRSRLPREVVLSSQRARLFEAVIEVVGTRGYVPATVGDIIRTARVSRSTFYEQFSDKESCFVAAYEEVAGLELDYVLAAAKQVHGPIGCLQEGVRAYLGLLAAERAYARASLIEVAAAGERAAGRRDQVHARYASVLGEWHERVRAQDASVPPLPEEIFLAAVGGVSELVAGSVRRGEIEQLPRLTPVAVTFLLTALGVPEGRELAAALSASRARRR